MKHVLFILTSADRVGKIDFKTGYEFSEVANPYLDFIAKGIAVDFASPAGGCPPESGYDASLDANRDFRISRGFLRLGFSHKLSAIDVAAYDAIFFPGGLGPMVDLVDAEIVKNIISQAYENDAVIGAVCHGPAALLNVKLANGRYLLAGKNVSCFTEAEEKDSNHHLGNVIPFLLDRAMREQGANLIHEPPFLPCVVSDGKLVTGQNPASASFVANAMIRLITGVTV
jgi:putative intracellular protease/amidase